MLVSDLVDFDLPEEFLECLPTECPFCGYPTEITAGLTALSCSNPFCSSRVGERMVAMLTDLGVKNLGPAKCQQFILTYQVRSPYALFAFAKRDGTATNVLSAECSKEFSDGIAAQINEKRSMLLWEYVRIGNLPGIRDSAKKLFQNYTSIEAFYADMENQQTGGINFIARLLDIRAEDTGYKDLNSADYYACSTKAIDVFKTLVQAKEELTYYQQYFDFKTITGAIVNICISTAVGKPYTSKADFIFKMNEAYDGSIHINKLSSVTKQCDVLVWSKVGAETNKVQKAKKADVPIVTGATFDTVMQAYLAKGGDIKELLEKAAQLEDTAGSVTVADLTK